jgi:phosphoserine phosphatase
LEEVGVTNLYNTDKLAIFDLDDTLIYGNSHLVVINQYSKIRFDSIVFKIIGKIAPSLYKKIIDKRFEKLSDEQIKQFRPNFNKITLELLTQKRNDGYEIFVISNAPQKLIDRICELIEVRGFSAKIGMKHKILEENFRYNKLSVCTDNKSDLSILKLASERYIYVNQKTKQFFKKEIPDSTFWEM